MFGRRLCWSLTRAGCSEVTEDPTRGRALPLPGPRGSAPAGRTAALGDCTAAGLHVPHLSPLWTRERVQATLPVGALSHGFEPLCLCEFCGIQRERRGLCCASSAADPAASAADPAASAGTGVALICPAGRGAQAHAIMIPVCPESLTSPIVDITPGSWCCFPRLVLTQTFPTPPRAPQVQNKYLPTYVP